MPARPGVVERRGFTNEEFARARALRCGAPDGWASDPRRGPQANTQRVVAREPARTADARQGDGDATGGDGDEGASRPSPGAIYTKRDDGLVEVEARRQGPVTFRSRRPLGAGRAALRRTPTCWSGSKAATRIRRAWRGGAAHPLVPRRVAAARPVSIEVPQARAPAPEIRGKKGHMDLGLEGRKALVTASSRGIGLAIAQTLADVGCDVGNLRARARAGSSPRCKDLESTRREGLRADPGRLRRRRPPARS